MKLEGRRIAPGRATGTALCSSAPVSFVGGTDAATGEVLDPATGCAGERLAGRVFTFPHGKGSTVGSYVLYGLVRRGVGPAAIVNARAEGIVAVGAILAEIPMVDRIDVAGIVTGDRVAVDGDRGEVELPLVQARPVVTAVLRNRGRVLVVRRSRMVGSFRGRWSGISGYLEGDEDPVDRARREIREETGMKGARLRARAPPVVARAGREAFVVHPLLFDAPSRRVRLDWENVEARWIDPADLPRLRSVPRLADVFRSVLAGGVRLRKAGVTGARMRP